jgi:hypothetical protein
MNTIVFCYGVHFNLHKGFWPLDWIGNWLRCLTYQLEITNTMSFITLFRSITMFGGTTNILQNIFHIQKEYEEYSIEDIMNLKNVMSSLINRVTIQNSF